MLSERFVEAVGFAIKAHGGQCRKGGGIPYVAHLLGVASLVLDAGGDEDLAIAGLLHDTIEDTGTTAQELESGFGPRVAAIVEACTDAHEHPKPPWRARKEQYLAHLQSADTPVDVLVVSRADKLHNARAILSDYRDVGEQLWGRFQEGPNQQVWYYGSLAEIFMDRLPGPMTDELSRVVAELTAELARNR
ncbi:MAG: HD domain-containing protein [Actinomycetota bacterium]|nr:HD domain-containing protein [Actinomycetota bacterium]MDQ6944777.1 HD domain-containing protein [Actinomycetota bacterium]